MKNYENIIRHKKGNKVLVMPKVKLIQSEGSFGFSVGPLFRLMFIEEFYFRCVLHITIS